MRIAYFVNRVSPHKVPRDIVIDGEASRQAVDQLEAELVDETGQHGTITLRFHKPSEIAEAAAAFRQGEMVTIDLSPIVPEKPEEPAGAAA